MGTIAAINGILAANISKIDGITASGIASVGGQTFPSAPPIPPFTNVAAAWGLFNFDPVGYPAGFGVNYENVATDTNDALFTEVAPYPLDWTLAGSAPYLVNTWDDQNANLNNLIAVGAARPILNAVAKRIEFDGVQTGMQGGALYTSGSATGTIYLDVQPLSLVQTGVILETDTFTNNAHTTRQISIRMVAGVLTATIFDNTALVALPNTKVKTIVATDRIFITFTWDTGVGVAANQTALYVNNSASGVTSAAAADLSGLLVGQGSANVGARNNAASQFVTANMWSGEAFTVVDDSAAKLVQYNYNQYLKTQ